MPVGVKSSGKEIAMRNIFRSRLGRASMALAIAGLGMVAVGASAEAETFISHAARWGQSHGYYAPRHNYAPHYRWVRTPYYSRPYYGQPYYGRPYYGPRYYGPPVVTYGAPYW
jgi:hypothetical protein